MTTLQQVVGTLNRASLHKRFDAFADVPWDDPDYGVDPKDPRWARDERDALGATDWYRSQPESRRARIGLDLTLHQLHLGIDFESLLSRGLLILADGLPLDDPARRYAYHEVIEEAQHTLMFRELILRSGLETQGLFGPHRVGSRPVPGIARRFPELFFFFVLGGEVPIDRMQRRALEREDELPPVLARVMRIHVTEEARHVSFAERFLRERIPRLPRWRRAFLAARVPIVIAQMTRHMLQPHPAVVHRHAIPGHVIDEVKRSARQKQDLIEAAARVHRIASDTGMCGPMTNWMWRRFGIAS